MTKIASVIAWKWPGAQKIVRDNILERWDGPMPRPTDAEIAAAVIEYESTGIELSENARFESINPNILATIAWIIRRSNINAWNNMTPVQKKAAVKTGAAEWKILREFFNLGAD